MLKYRRGVSLEQHLDDHSRHGVGQEVFNATPDKGLLLDGQVIVLKGQGKIMWRDGDKTYVITGTLVG